MVEPTTGALVAAMAPPPRVRGPRPSKLHDGAVVSRVPALPTPLIAQPDRWLATDRSREQLLDALASMEDRHDAKERARRELAVRLLLDWLAEFDGASWQQGWMASGADAAGRSWSGLVQFRGVNKEYRTTQMTGAVARLILLDAIRPSYSWLFTSFAGTLYERFREIRDPEGFAALDVVCAQTTPRLTPTDRRTAYVQLSRILIHTGGRLVDITLDDCVEASRAQVQYSHKNHTHWYPLLRQAGILPESTPPSMLSATRRGQLSIAEIVDAQQVQCRPVRDLFVDYLHERAPGLDYSSLVALVSKIVRLFWRDLEIHEPGIDSLHLSDDVARRWKLRLSEVRHGRQRIRQPRQDLAANLMAVRAFYADLTHWALEDPARWAGWVALSPVTSRDLAKMGKQRQRAVARTHQRTRELAPVLPQLVVRADAQRRSAEALLAASGAAGSSEVFESGDVTLRRLPPTRSGGRPDVIFAQAVDGDGPRINVTLLDDYAFWAWASIEILRHTGCGFGRCSN